MRQENNAHILEAPWHGAVFESSWCISAVDTCEHKLVNDDLKLYKTFSGIKIMGDGQDLIQHLIHLFVPQISIGLISTKLLIHLLLIRK